MAAFGATGPPDRSRYAPSGATLSLADSFSALFSHYVRKSTRICEAVCWCFANEFRGGAGRRGVVGIVADAGAAAKKRLQWAFG